MTIAFDIDGCWSLAPLMWLRFYINAKGVGNICIFVTGREQPREKLERLSIPDNAIIIVSGSRFKKQAALDAGYSVDIWIDNEPGTIEPARILASADNSSL